MRSSTTIVSQTEFLGGGGGGGGVARLVAWSPPLPTWGRPALGSGPAATAVLSVHFTTAAAATLVVLPDVSWFWNRLRPWQSWALAKPSALRRLSSIALVSAALNCSLVVAR